MRSQAVALGRERTPADGCRRYRPIELTFDSRSVVLDQEVGEDWTPDIQAQWRSNQSKVRMELLAEYGTAEGEAKIENYRAMGPAPWSIVAEHNALLAQTRSAFAHDDFYPALVSACALGERIFNQLILTLRDDYVNHKAAIRRVRRDDTFTDWGSSIEVLRGWGVLTDDLTHRYLDLERQRHAAVHFDPAVSAGTREPALQALRLIQEIIEGVFAPHGGPPRFIANIPGASFFSLASEELPIVKRIFLPRSALLSPAHRMFVRQTAEGIAWEIYDDAEYDPTDLSDAGFAEAIPAGVASMHPES
jgi:hypothetical protein